MLFLAKYSKPSRNPVGIFPGNRRGNWSRHRMKKEIREVMISGLTLGGVVIHGDCLCLDDGISHMILREDTDEE